MHNNNKTINKYLVGTFSTSQQVIFGKKKTNGIIYKVYVYNNDQQYISDTQPPLSHDFFGYSSVFSDLTFDTKKLKIYIIFRKLTLIENDSVLFRTFL